MTSPRPVGRLRWLLPALLILVWLVIAGITGPLAGQLSSVATNDSSTFLPASAESTQVEEKLSEFTDNSFVPAIVIAENPDGITAQDRDFLADTVDPLAGQPGFGPAFSPPIPSADGQAAQLFVPIATDGDPAEAIDELRAALDDAPDGLSVLVTGPAGQIADLGEAFAGIDGLLLLVAGAVVLFILVVVYRSPLLPIVVLISSIFALALASGAVYGLAKADVLVLNGQSQGIMFILVFGAATDYALLVVARYREELALEEDRFKALATAWRAILPAISASAATVILGVLCLLFSDLNSNRSLGPVAAAGIVASYLASLTFLPACLALLGRAAFWPRRPEFHPGADPETESAASHRIWRTVADKVAAAPRAIWVTTAVVLIIGACFAPMFKADGIASSDFFMGDVDSVLGEEVLLEHFDAGQGTPTWVLTNADTADQTLSAIRGVNGVVNDGTAVLTEADGRPTAHDGQVAIEVTLNQPADSLAAQDIVAEIRDVVGPISGADAMVGGSTAVDLDTRLTAAHDRNLIIPIVLVVVFVVLMLLLRSIAAPILLLGTTVLSFATTLGIAALLFNGPFGFPGADPVVPLYAFVFLVALGIDYNIFLMTRAREESLRYGVHKGMIRALTSTGGVITSAGVVLAATFAALAVIPLLFLAQIAFLVAFGVLIDTLIVRSLLVPAFTLDVGRPVWWPNVLSRAEHNPPGLPQNGSGTETGTVDPGEDDAVPASGTEK